MSNFCTAYSLGERVRMPGEMVGFVRSFSVTHTGVRYEVGWWINGELREAWFSESELERVKT